jgi:hypothetical protein
MPMHAPRVEVHATHARDSVMSSGPEQGPHRAGDDRRPVAACPMLYKGAPGQRGRSCSIRLSPRGVMAWPAGTLLSHVDANARSHDPRRGTVRARGFTVKERDQ